MLVVYLCAVVPSVAAQMKEIEEECSKLPSTVAVPTRLLLSEQKKQAAAVSVSAASRGGEDEEEGDEGEESVGGTYACRYMYVIIFLGTAT